MSTEKKSFFLKLNPPRASFMMDMTVEEKSVMQKHVAYWAPFQVDSNEHLQQLLANDPANGLNSYEFYPMRAVTKQQ